VIEWLPSRVGQTVQHATDGTGASCGKIWALCGVPLDWPPAKKPSERRCRNCEAVARTKVASGTETT